MKKIFFNERGYIFVEVIFLTLITSFVAAMLLNGISKLQNNSATLQITAQHLVNEQFALIENYAIYGGSYQIDSADLKTYNMDENFPIEFDVQTDIKNYSENILKAVVKVSWSFGEKNFAIEQEKLIWKISGD